MRKVIALILYMTLANFYCIQIVSAEEKGGDPNKPLYVVAGEQAKLTPFSGDEETRRILKRCDIERNGYNLAKQGLYEEAIVKYQQAIEPSLLNHEYDKDTALWSIRDIHERQGKLDLALKEHDWFLKANPTKDQYLDKDLELRALIKARDTKSNQPIYDHIKYLRNKYKKYIPPQSQGDSGFHTTPIDSIIHLYDWMGDADGGIKFMEEIISSKTLYSNERKEYERVKAAFEEDKRTGEKGHLAKVIATSDIIGW